MPETTLETQPLEPSADDKIRRAGALILGGGISGLALAAFLRRDGVDAVVLERSERPGGAIGSLEHEGFVFERGPNTVLDKYASLDELIEWAGLNEAAVRVPMRSQARHVWLKGALHPAPTGPGTFMRSPLLSFKSKLALMREPFVRAEPGDETVAAFVTRRLGREWLENLITPVVTGIWAGDPERLSIAHAFPVMKEMERDGGSILRGAMKQKLRARKEGRRKKRLVSFVGGLQRLPRAIALKLGEAYQGRAEALTVSAAPGGEWAVRVLRPNGEEIWKTPRLVVAAEGHQSAEWLRPHNAELATALDAVRYNQLAIVSLGIDAAGAALPPGFGFLAPRRQGLNILGCITNSNFIPSSAPPRCATMAVFTGGDLEPGVLDLEDQKIVEVVIRDLRKALKWDGRVKAMHIQRWPRGIPQYDMNQGAREALFERAEADRPGLYLAGNWRGGVAVGERVERMKELAARMKAAAMTDKGAAS